MKDKTLLSGSNERGESLVGKNCLGDHNIKKWRRKRVNFFFQEIIYSI